MGGGKPANQTPSRKNGSTMTWAWPPLPPQLFKFPFVVSATPINYLGAAYGQLRLSTILGGIALCAPPIDSMIDYGVPPPDRWLKDLKGRMKAACTPQSPEKLAIKKQQRPRLSESFCGTPNSISRIWRTCGGQGRGGTSITVS